MGLGIPETLRVEQPEKGAYGGGTVENYICFAISVLLGAQRAEMHSGGCCGRSPTGVRYFPAIDPDQDTWREVVKLRDPKLSQPIAGNCIEQEFISVMIQVSSLSMYFAYDTLIWKAAYAVIPENKNLSKASGVQRTMGEHKERGGKRMNCI